MFLLCYPFTQTCRFSSLQYIMLNPLCFSRSLYIPEISAPILIVSMSFLVPIFFKTSYYLSVVFLVFISRTKLMLHQTLSYPVIYYIEVHTTFLIFSSVSGRQLSLYLCAFGFMCHIFHHMLLQLNIGISLIFMSVICSSLFYC